MQAMILAAGFGSRLAPLTQWIPKPLMPIGDRPILAHLFGQLEGAGCDHMGLNTHHGAEAIEALVAQVSSLRVRRGVSFIEVSREMTILGTAGGVRRARRRFRPGDLLVWNGDIFAPSLQLASLWREHVALRSFATWVVTPRAAGEGTVGTGEGGTLVRLRGERFGRETAGGDFLGIQILSAAALDALPAEGCLTAELALPALRSGARIATFFHEGDWTDIGTPASLWLANASWLKGRGADANAYVAPGVEVPPLVTLQGSVLGAGSVVHGEGALERVVVFPNAIAEAPLANMLVTPYAQIPWGRPLTPAGAP